MFGPTLDEVRPARRVIDAYERAKSRGEGAITVDGEMVDEAVLKVRARRAEAAKKLGLWNPVEVKR